MKRSTFSAILPKLLAMVLVFALAFSVAASAYTAEEKNTMAQGLKELSLFNGYSETDFGLKDAPTREQALAFQIRVLGEDAAAKAWKGTCPYSDVPAKHWAAPYIGYAVEKGYTNGIGNGKFGLGQPADAKMMTTFVLRGLGYSDSLGDFTFNTSLGFGLSKGLLETSKAPATFTRGDAVAILFNALPAQVKGSTDTLIATLVKKGVVNDLQLEAFAVATGVKPAPMTPEEAYVKVAKGVMAGYEAMDAAVAAVLQEVEKLPDGADITKYVVALNDGAKSLKDLAVALDAIAKDVPASYLQSYQALVATIRSYAAGIDSYVSYVTTGNAADLKNAQASFAAADQSYQGV